MIVWIMAQKRTGKSTLARLLKPCYENCVVIDDGVREAVLSNIPQDERPKAIYMACARLAKVLDRQGFNVIIVGGVEKKEWRKELKARNSGVATANSPCGNPLLFCSTHQHDASGLDFHVRHKAIALYWDPEDK